MQLNDSSNTSSAWFRAARHRGTGLALALFAGVASGGLPLARVANTTLQVPQAPATFGYEFNNAFPGVTFNSPMAIVVAPGETNRLFIVERAGVIAVITNLTAPNRTAYLDIKGKIDLARDDGLQTMCFHPGFATNGLFYLYYTGLDTTPAPGGTNTVHDILARYSVPLAATNFASPATEQKILRQYDRQADHNGADLHFGPDGYLYLSLGDEGSPGAVGYDYYTNSQYIDRSFFSAILRLDVDRKLGNLVPNPHPAIVPNTYLVPQDNPFVGATDFNGLAVVPGKVRTEFWAVGLRNPFRFSFDEATGRLYEGDVGQKHYEEINLITKGGNYGWIWREGAHPTTLLDGNSIARPVAPGFTNYIDPIFELVYGTGATQGECIIGGLVYRGERISQLYGYYVFGDYINGNVFAFKYDGTNATRFQTLGSVASVVAFGADPANGDVLAANIANGRIYRLAYNTNSVTGTPLPATLAATGAFTNLTTLTPAPGVAAYDLNVPFWSDHAVKSRWVCVPNTNLTIGFRATDNWLFPTGTIWIKHFELPLTNGAPSSARRLETRLLVKNTDGVYGVSYRWGTNTTNATLVAEEGLDEAFVIRDRGGGIVRTQTWHYPARVKCLKCHTPVAGHALGFNTPQLNRDYNYGGAIANQIQALSDAGYFTTPVANPASMLALADATNTLASVERRVRSYLAANCLSCHQPGGLPEQTAAWDARIFTPLALAGIVDGLLASDFGDPHNRVVKFGSLSNSVLYRRVANLGPNHMPPLATSVINTQAVELLSAWITNPPAVHLAEAGPGPDGAFQFTLAGSWGWSAIIEAATNLSALDWRAIGTNIFGTDGSSIFVDPGATNHPARFYRAITP